MKFALRGYRVTTPVPSLGGGLIRLKPVIPLTLIGPAGIETPLVLVDSGADDVVFPIHLAQRVGVDLSGAPQRTSQGAGTPQVATVSFAPVILSLSDSVETWRWRAVVGFTASPLRFPLFGIAGGLEFFRTILDVARRELELCADPSIPTTKDQFA